MTVITNGPPYVGARRFKTRPLSVTRPRHRAPEALVVALVAQLAELLLGAGRTLALFARGLVIVFSGSWAARTGLRAFVVVSVASALLAVMLIASALVLVDPVTSEPRPMLVTPSPTPFPDGWTYEGR